jgi:hypothetical protein
VVGLLMGGGAVGAAWALTGGAGSGPASDAQGACNAPANLDESKITSEGDEGKIALYRWGASYELSVAAAAGDSKYKPLEEAVHRSRIRQAEGYEFKKELAKARSICDDL